MGKDRKEDRDRSSDRNDDDDRKESSKHRSASSRRRRSESDDDASSVSERKERKGRSREGRRKRKERHRSRSSDDENSSSESSHRRRKKERRRRKKSSDRKHKRSSKRRRKERSRKDSESSTSGSSDDDSAKATAASKKKVVNEKLLAKLEARGETLEERNARRAQKRAARIHSMFGYTADDNPFNDPELHEKFTWKKREESRPKGSTDEGNKNASEFYDEIDKVRKRRKQRDQEREEMERIRREEDRMKELENYDEWAKKEEEFHLQQQRQRSAIRLVEGREKPVDVLAKNLLLFGLSDEEKKNRGAVKYQEKFNAIEALEALEVELEEPQNMLKVLKLEELEELRMDIDAFRTLEREALSYSPGKPVDDSSNTVLQYWNSLLLVVDDEVKLLKSGGPDGAHGKMVAEVGKIFEGRAVPDLVKMKDDINTKLKHGAGSMDFDTKYWQSVADQLDVHLAKATLSDIHGKMLVRQLERLEKRREELTQQPEAEKLDEKPEAVDEDTKMPPTEDAPIESGDLEDELGLSSEVDLVPKSYNWQHKYAPRRPRYFNRVKTGYDWNKYNQTHYDRDNPPPKVVQGYKFNIFYPDLVDHTKTPQFRLEPADTDEFCIIRFSAGPPYEDIAFKIVNREWNRSRKRGFKSTFERGVLSLYFNFTTHWYRR